MKLAPLLLSLVACGSAAGSSYDPPLVTFRGTITSSSVATPDTVRVALVWRLPDGASQGLVATQELGVRAQFPATFHLDVNALPPPEVMHPISPIVPGKPTAYAIGTLLVYEDTNGNGHLDPVPVDATASIDRVLGTPARLEIIYLEGGGIPKNPDAPRTDEDYVSHDEGYNFVFEPAEGNYQPGCETDACSWTKQDVTASLDIALTANPALARALCEAPASQTITMPATCASCVGAACASCPIAPDAIVICNADRSYVAQTCTTASLCGAENCVQASGSLDASGVVPAGWPCP